MPTYVVRGQEVDAESAQDAFSKVCEMGGRVLVGQKAKGGGNLSQPAAKPDPKCHYLVRGQKVEAASAADALIKFLKMGGSAPAWDIAKSDGNLPQPAAEEILISCTDVSGQYNASFRVLETAEGRVLYEQVLTDLQHLDSKLKIVVNEEVLQEDRLLKEQSVKDGSLATCVFELIMEEEQAALIKKMFHTLDPKGGPYIQCLLFFGGNAHKSFSPNVLPPQHPSDLYSRQVWNSIRQLQWPLNAQNFRGVLPLPIGLESLTFDDLFDEGLETVKFPSSIKDLTFGQNFNQSLENVMLPSDLQNLTLGQLDLRGFYRTGFNQPMEHVQLPSGLKSLNVGSYFNQRLDTVTWPLGLESLVLGGSFRQSLEKGTLPPSLKTLTLYWDDDTEKVVLPTGLQKLTLLSAGSIGELPTLLAGLEELTLDVLQRLDPNLYPDKKSRDEILDGLTASLERLALPSSLKVIRVAEDLQ